MGSQQRNEALLAKAQSEILRERREAVIAQIVAQKQEYRELKARIWGGPGTRAMHERAWIVAKAPLAKQLDVLCAEQHKIDQEMCHLRKFRDDQIADGTTVALITVIRLLRDSSKWTAERVEGTRRDLVIMLEPILERGGGG